MLFRSNKKKSKIDGKGILNNRISEHILSNLNQIGIKNHLVKRINMREQLIKIVEIIPIEFIVRNISAGSLSKRLGIEDGTVLDSPLIEYCYKSDDLGDPLLTEDHIEIMDLATEEEVAILKEKALKVNEVLSQFFKELGIRLVDFKLEFGKDASGAILLADEISPDTCRFWDLKTNEKLDKDVFRRDLGNLTDAYENILSRLGGKLHV